VFIGVPYILGLTLILNQYIYTYIWLCVHVNILVHMVACRGMLARLCPPITHRSICLFKLSRPLGGRSRHAPWFLAVRAKGSGQGRCSQFTRGSIWTSWPVTVPSHCRRRVLGASTALGRHSWWLLLCRGGLRLVHGQVLLGPACSRPQQTPA
jgi:hypothetical protein